MKMTQKERVMTASRRQVPDRVPRWIDYASFAPILMETFKKKTGACNPAEFFNYDVRQVSFKPPVQRRIVEKYLPANFPANAEVDWNWGNVFIRADHKNVEVTVHYALEDAETVEDIEAYPMPDFLEEYRWAHVRREVDDRLFKRLFLDAVFFMEDDLRLRDLELVPFAAHVLEQHRDV